MPKNLFYKGQEKDNKFNYLKQFQKIIQIEKKLTIKIKKIINQNKVRKKDVNRPFFIKVTQIKKITISGEKNEKIENRARNHCGNLSDII